VNKTKSNVDDAVSVRSSLHSVSHLQTNDVLLVSGKVTSVNNLPAPIQQDRDGRVFFRVLYAGGEKSTKSALFQCKTSVFESELAMELSERIVFKKTSFKFEIDKLLDFDDNIPGHGDIIFAVYRQRSFGGNEFVGQLTVDVSKLCQEGERSRSTMQSYTIQKRAIKSILRLYDRSGSTVIRNASIAVELSISWRVESSFLSDGAKPLATPVSPNRILKRPLSATSSVRSRMRNPLEAFTGRGAITPTTPKEPSLCGKRPTSAALASRSKPAVVPLSHAGDKPSSGVVKPRLNKAQKEFQWKVERYVKKHHLLPTLCCD
jgi:hypothetical protein